MIRRGDEKIAQQDKIDADMHDKYVHERSPKHSTTPRNIIVCILGPVNYCIINSLFPMHSYRNDM